MRVALATAQYLQKFSDRYLGRKGHIIRKYFSFMWPRRLCHISTILIFECVEVLDVLLSSHADLAISGSNK